jgi:hypothetical protein
MTLLYSFQYLSILTQKLKITVVNAQIYILLKLRKLLESWITFNLCTCNSLHQPHFIPGQLILYGRALKPVACITCEWSSRRDKNHELFDRSLGVKKKWTCGSSKKLTSNLRAWLQVVLGRLWPAGRQLDHVVLKHSLYACWGLPYCLVLRRLQRIRSMCADPLTCLRIMTGPVDTNVAQNCSCTASDFAVWWPWLKNNPTVTHSCRKRRL